jgi:hypothetical protein
MIQMSAGDKDNPDPFTLPETKTILNLPIVAKQMARRRAVNPTDWDIPYLAGYSKDGNTIFIDRDLSFWNYKGRYIDTDQFLKIHEGVEKAIIDALHEAKDHDLEVLLSCLRMKSPTDEIYFHAHGVATCAELYAVEMAFGAAGVAAYNKFMRGQVKRAEDERIRRVPISLDLTPYSGNDVQDRRLRAAMKRATH